MCSFEWVDLMCVNALITSTCFWRLLFPQCFQLFFLAQNLNYDMVSGKLFLPPSTLQPIAVLLVEACVQVEQERAGIMLKSIDQVSSASKFHSCVRFDHHFICELIKIKMTSLWQTLEIFVGFKSCVSRAFDREFIRATISLLELEDFTEIEASSESAESSKQK